MALSRRPCRALGAAVPAARSRAASSKVTVGDNFFKPARRSRSTAGTKVTWTNKGKILHNVKPDKGKAFGDEASFGAGSAYSYTFKKPGTYAYYCSFHGCAGTAVSAARSSSSAGYPRTTTHAALLTSSRA